MRHCTTEPLAGLASAGRTMPGGLFEGGMNQSRLQGQACIRGFTLIELMVVVVIVAILASVAFPSYESYVKKSKAKTAAADLVAWSLVMENINQKRLAYPTYAANTPIPPQKASRSEEMQKDFEAWAPAQADDFDYRITSTKGSYTLTAQSKGKAWCTLTLNDLNERQFQNCSVLSRW